MNLNDNYKNLNEVGCYLILYWLTRYIYIYMFLFFRKKKTLMIHKIKVKMQLKDKVIIVKDQPDGQKLIK